MPDALYFLALLACPAAMAVMMRMMMRGSTQQSAPAAAPQQAELVRLQAQIDQLQAEREHRGLRGEEHAS